LPSTSGWVIYSCYGGNHTSPLAAGLHLGLIPRGRPLTLAALRRLPPFDRQTNRDLGRLVPWGPGPFGHQVATVGHGGQPALVRTAILSALGAGMPAPPGPVLWVDLYDLLTPLLRVGGLLSRRLGWVGPGQALIVRALEGIRPRLERRVAGVLAELARQAGFARVLSPDGSAGQVWYTRPQPDEG